MAEKGEKVKHTVHKDAICPYYRHEDSQVIYCDGVSDQSVIHLAFANKSDSKAYKVNYCRGHWQKCHIVNMLDEVTNERE